MQGSGSWQHYVAITLEREGIASFEKSWNELIASVEKQLQRKYLSIVGEDEADPITGKIAWSSPMAQAIDGARTGETIELDLPGVSRPCRSRNWSRAGLARSTPMFSVALLDLPDDQIDMVLNQRAKLVRRSRARHQRPTGP